MEKLNTPSFSGTSVEGYWQNFSKRNKHKIIGKRGQKYELSCQNWTTYNNFVLIYSHMVGKLVHAKLTVNSDYPAWENKIRKLCTNDKVYGYKVYHKIVRPRLYFCGDKVDGNISMKSDGQNRGELLLTALN